MTRNVYVYGAAALAFLASIWLAYKFANDVSAAIGIVGSGASIFGIIVAVEQSIQTRTAAVAARSAAEQAASRLRSSYYRYALLNARRHLTESLALIGVRQWSHVSLRLRDAADQFLDIAYARREPDQALLDAANGTRIWAEIFSRGRLRRPLVYDENSWTEWYSFVQERIAREAGPFDAIDLGE